MKLIFTTTLLTMLIVSCAEDSNPILSSSDKFNEIEILTGNGYRVNVLSLYDTTLREGATTFYLDILDKEGRLNFEDVKLDIFKESEVEIRNTPFEYSIVEIDNDKYIKVDAVFIGGTLENQKWKIRARSETGNYSLIMDVKVEFTGNVTSFSYNDYQYFLTLHSPLNAKMNNNDFIISVYKTDSYQTFEPVKDFDFEFEPYLPSEGIYSYNNQQLAYTENGFYKGRIFFNSPGYWEADLVIYQNEKWVNKKTYYFEIGDIF